MGSHPRLQKTQMRGLVVRLDALDDPIDTRRDALMSYVDCFLHNRQKMWPSIRRPVVFDIDDTLLTRHNGRDRVVKRVLKTYNTFRRHFPTYIVTARTEDHGLTAEDLRRVGITGYADLLMLPEGEDPGAFKWRARQQIARRHGGLHPQLTVGDQPWDVLPNVRGDARRLLCPKGCLLIHPRGKSEVGVYLPEHDA